LRPRAQARADGDQIYSVIRGTGINQDGRTSGIALPNGEAQAALLRQVYARSGVPPSQVRFIEAHGTGTTVGDPIETKALGSVLTACRSPDDICMIGSVKANIGHLESAAGVAGLIKASLCLKHGL